MTSKRRISLIKSEIDVVRPRTRASSKITKNPYIIKNLPNELMEDIKMVNNRFLSNISQIEEKYCRFTSGTSLSTKDDKIYFDPALCTIAQNESNVVRPRTRTSTKITKNPRDNTKNLPNELMEGIKSANKRFIFNISQIEEKYCRYTSGISLNTVDDEVYFEPDLCTSENDQEFSKLLKKEKRNMKKKFGDSLLSTPAIDPAVSDELTILRWRKLNKRFSLTTVEGDDKENRTISVKRELINTTPLNF